jgi:hypothetical protein
MPEDEPESPMEKIGEELREAAERTREGWLKWSALLSVLFAVMAALAGLESAHYANDAMIKQIQASDQWNYYQAKGIKAMLLETEMNILKRLDKPVSDGDEKLQKYRAEQQEIKNESTRLSEDSKQYLEKHEVLSRAVTLFQISIAIVGIAVLTRRRYFILVSVVLGAAGIFFLLQEFMLP